ncbi:MAG: hypothetical protein IT186_23330 [Acidobacteria bacterium]|nr:hypothetical protein [Acidobacteriota bacterium]MCG3192281.1 hypothetical protein [Thermoanaerobaculia bacterium]MCK6682560.1 hypothetical protein [Thermoanaerobaculia bacterium]
MLSKGRLVRLAPVDLSANARARRHGPEPGDDPAPMPTKSAADLAFERDFTPVVDQDGGFCDPTDEE